MNVHDLSEDELAERFGPFPPQYVYRIYDADDVLLYVGRSRDPEGRMVWHERPWYSGALSYAHDLAARMDHHVVSDPMSEADAEQAEALAIWDEDPVFNVHRPWQRPRERVDNTT